MGDDESRPPAAASDPVEEDLYDAYLDDVLAGRARRPSRFLAGHPGVSDTFRTRIEELYASRRHRGDEARDTADGPGLPFERLGEYRVLERLGEGGMGTVYLGEQESLGRLAALKVLRPEYQGSSTAAARFQREAHVVARLRHPNIVTVYGVGEERGVRFLAMEYVPGEGLDEVTARAAEGGDPLPVATCVRWGAQIAGALQAAHEAGVVHRDVKPSNIRITPEGRPLLLDFGVALDDAPSRLTVGTKFLGTMVYAAPEQAQSGDDEATRDADARSDVYSLGVTLYEAVTGRAPFDAGTTQQVLHRMLTEDAPPVRQVRPGVPRDLEVVLQKAMEKDPARRYETAVAFADDLDAVLKFRPIAARSAGPLRRSWKWARRHPGAASALAAVAVAAIAYSAAEYGQARLEHRRRVRDAAALVQDASGRVDALRAQTLAWSQKLGARGRLEHDLQGRYLAPEEHRELIRLEHEISVFRREREAAHYEVLEKLRRAESLHRDVAGTDGVRAKLFHVRYLLAQFSGEREAGEFFAERVKALDEDGALTRQIAGHGEVAIESDVPGTRGFLFRYEALDRIRDGGEPRLVPVPVDGSEVVPPGSWALRAPLDEGPLRAGDLVLELGGRAVSEGSWAELQRVAAAAGGPAAVHRAGELRELTVRASTTLRPTAAPLAIPHPRHARDVTGEAWTLPFGSYVIVARAPGRETVRVPFFVRNRPEPLRIAVRPPATGTTPDGFVHVSADENRGNAAFWIMEREVTAGEYLEFLNDPETLAEIDAAAAPIRFPRSPGTVVDGGHWPRGEDGRYVMAGELRADWPIIGVSYEDALAYAAWYTAHRPREGFVFSLPTYLEWQSAGAGDGGRIYPWGQRFHPAWTCSCFSLPTANVEPVLSYPIDESWSGAYDMAGSVFEWLDDWFDEARGLRRVAGGSWGRADPKLFRVEGGAGAGPRQAGDEYGFRLVMRRVAGDEDR